MHLPFVAKYTYTTGDCVEYDEEYIRKGNVPSDELFFYSVAKRCLLDSKCRAFKFIFFRGHYSLCHTYIPRPSNSTWEGYQDDSITFLLDLGEDINKSCTICRNRNKINYVLQRIVSFFIF